MIYERMSINPVSGVQATYDTSPCTTFDGVSGRFVMTERHMYENHE